MRRAILNALRAKYEAEIAEADATANIYLDNLPTTGLAEIDFSCLKWNDISSKNSNLIQLKFPKQLK